MSGVPELTLRNLTVELKKLTNPLALGNGLGFSDHELDIIKRDNPLDVNDQKYALFSKISRNYRSMRITWDKIADALDTFVGDQDLALEIRKKFCLVEKTTDHKIDEIATKVGIDPGTLDQPCHESHLLEISKLLLNWSSYSDHLGLLEQELLEIQRNVALTGYHMKPLKMLERWQQKKAYSPQAHYRHLLKGCLEINEDAQLVGNICQLILKKPI